FRAHPYGDDRRSPRGKRDPAVAADLSARRVGARSGAAGRGRISWGGLVQGALCASVAEHAIGASVAILDSHVGHALVEILCPEHTGQFLAKLEVYVDPGLLLLGSLQSGELLQLSL